MIFLEKVYLSNWYGFTDEMIPFSSGSTFITGENESGKSTILDAIKYAFMSDTQFNKGAAVTGEKKRTLASYTRCLYNATENLYARNEDVIFSHVFLGWYDDEEDKRFATGCIIRTKKEDTNTHWFIIEERIENLLFKKVVDNKEFILSYQEFKSLNGKNAKIFDYDSWAIAKENFMHRLGLHMTSSEIDKYRDEMRHMVTYKAGSMKITEFIDQFVLKEDPVDIENLITSKQKYDELKSNMDKLEAEAEMLKVMKGNFDKYIALERKKQVNDYKILLDSCREKTLKLKEQERVLSATSIKLKELDKEIETVDQNIETLRDKLRNLEVQSMNSDGAEQIESLNIQIKTVTQAIEKANSEIAKIKKLYEILNQFKEYNIIDFELINITDAEISASEKEQYLVELSEVLNAKKSDFEKQNGVQEDKLNILNRRIQTLDNEISTLRNNVQVYDSKANNAIKLKNAINKKLESMNRNGRAYLASELVIELTDESWRNALEAYVGSNRYSVLVSTSNYNIASSVQQELKLPYAKLINIVKLENKKVSVDEESVMKYMRIENPVAHKYFAYLLGNTHEATHETAFDHTPSLCKDLYFIKELYSDYMEPAKIACLGLEAKKLNLQKKESEKIKVLKEKESLQKEISAISNKIIIIDNVIKSINSPIDLRVYETLKSESKELSVLQRQLAETEIAIKNDVFYFKIREQIEELKRKESELYKTRNLLTDKRSQNKQIQIDCNKTIENLKLELATEKEALFNKEQQYPESATIAQNEHDEFWKKVESGKTSKKYSYVNNEDIVGDLRVAKDRLHKSELEYIKIYGGNIDADYFEVVSAYEGFQTFIERLNLLEVDKIQEAKRKAEEEQKNLNGIFKEQFVSEIYNKIQVAQKKLRMINKELAKMSYNTEYQFTQEYLKDGSDFATIIEYARETQKIQDGQFNPFDVNVSEDGNSSKLEVLGHKIVELIDKMTSKNADKNILNELSDYRNYLTYDIMQTDKTSGQKGYLSKESGYNSGAGTQIPYTIILAVALVMEYNREEGESTVRLIMLDEPFEKMSSENVKKTMELFKELKLQAIFCGASKMDSIGENCGTIIPVLKLSKKNMTVGSVEEKD